MLPVAKRAPLLLVAGVAVSALSAVPAAAQTVVEAKAPSSVGKGSADPLPVPTLVVTGQGETRYDRVATKALDAWLLVRAPEPPKRGKDPAKGHVDGPDGKAVVTLDKPFGAGWSSHLAKVDPALVKPVGGGTLRPVDLCNARLASLAGSQRLAFLKEGGTIEGAAVLRLRARQDWYVRPVIGTFADLIPFWDDVDLKVAIACRPLAGPKARDTTTTTAGKAPPTKKIDPTVSEVSLRAVPQNYQKIGEASCPTRVALSGLVATRREFHGRARFAGPGWMSDRIPVDLDEAGRAFPEAVYDVDWSRRPGKHLSRRDTTPDWTMTFVLKVTDSQHAPLDEGDKTLTLSCMPIATPVM